MQVEADIPVPQPTSREFKLGFTSRRRRLRNRWNIHMRKDERAQAKALDRDAAQSGLAAESGAALLAAAAPALKL
jgi:hypothetical protein